MFLVFFPMMCDVALSRLGVSGGVLLLAVAVFFFRFFGLYREWPVELVSKSLVVILFLGPLLASGVALLRGEAVEEPGIEV
jgi:hypothetical protein